MNAWHRGLWSRTLFYHSTPPELRLLLAHPSAPPSVECSTAALDACGRTHQRSGSSTLISTIRKQAAVFRSQLKVLQAHGSACNDEGGQATQEAWSSAPGHPETFGRQERDYLAVVLSNKKLCEALQMELGMVERTMLTCEGLAVNFLYDHGSLLSKVWHGGYLTGTRTAPSVLHSAQQHDSTAQALQPYSEAIRVGILVFKSLGHVGMAVIKSLGGRSTLCWMEVSIVHACRLFGSHSGDPMCLTPTPSSPQAFYQGAVSRKHPPQTEALRRERGWVLRLYGCSAPPAEYAWL